MQPISLHMSKPTWLNKEPIATAKKIWRPTFQALVNCDSLWLRAEAWMVGLGIFLWWLINFTLLTLWLIIYLSVSKSRAHAQVQSLGQPVKTLFPALISSGVICFQYSSLLLWVCYLFDNISCMRKQFVLNIEEKGQPVQWPNFTAILGFLLWSNLSNCSQ